MLELHGVVILSTHLVEDVSDLCHRMAVLTEGRVQVEGSPQELIHSNRGRIWMKVVDRAELPLVREQYEVLSTRLFAGRTVVHVLSDRDPGNGFTPVEAGLQDVYFSTLAHATLRNSVMLSLVFMFVTTSFVANAVIRRAATGRRPTAPASRC